MTANSAKLRKCSDCPDGIMHPVSRTIQIYDSAIHYKCTTCDAAVDITPPASIGVMATVGTLAIAFWSTIVFSGPIGPDLFDYTIFAFFALMLLWMVVIPWAKLHLHPVVEASDETFTPEVAKSAHIGQKIILWIENFGVIGGLLAPILFMGSILGIAGLIGYISFTFF